jgi:hypothetical protein
MPSWLPTSFVVRTSGNHLRSATRASVSVRALRERGACLAESGTGGRFAGTFGTHGLRGVLTTFRYSIGGILEESSDEDVVSNSPASTITERS